MPKWVKFIIALLLLPVCAGAAMALWMVITHSGEAETIWVAIVAGLGCWIAIYLLLPRPMWIYVFGHELTHALWAWCCGAEVKKMKVTSSGGHVILSKTNFLITLAPYFFPLYAVLVVGAFVLGNLLWHWQRYEVWFHLLLGAAYGFHVSLTWETLKTQQSDITSQGYLFSAVIIFIGNALILLVGIPLLAAKVDVATAIGWWFECTGQVIHWIGRLL